MMETTLDFPREESDETWTAAILVDGELIFSKGLKDRPTAEEETKKMLAEHRKKVAKKLLDKNDAERAKQFIEDEQAKQAIKDATQKPK